MKVKVLFLAQLVSIFTWLSLLTPTDSYYSVYLLLGILSSVSLYYNYRHPAKRTILDYIFPACFSLMVTLANFQSLAQGNESLTLHILVVLALLFAAGFFVFFALLPPIKAFTLRTVALAKHVRPSPLQFFFITFSIIALFDLIIFFTCFYPGCLTPDSISEIQQILTGNFSNHHPFYFTMLIAPFIHFGVHFLGDINLGVALYSIFQVLIVSAAFAYSISTLYRLGISRKLLIITTIIIMLLPYNIMYSFTMWKDIMFAAIFLIFIVTLYRYFNKITIKHQIPHLILIAISALGICLFRSNGFIAMIITLAIFFIIFRKKYLKLSLLLLGVTFVAFILKYPVLKALNVKQPDTIESLSIPSQQIVRTLAYEKHNLSSEDLELISSVADPDALVKSYAPEIHDPVKVVVRTTGNQNYIKEHPIDFALLYLKLGLKYPLHYLKAWIDETRGYWNGGYSFWIWATDVQINDFGIKSQVNSNFLRQKVIEYIEYFHEVAILQPLISIGVAVWILFILLYKNLATKNKVNIFLLTPLLATWFTLLIATPVFSEFRYAYFIFTCLPFLFFISFIPSSKS